MAPEIFVSYARRDSPFVRDLMSFLKAAGIPVWIDLSGIDVAAPWQARIRDSIASASYFIVVLSPYSVASSRVREELDIAVQNGKTIVPVLLQDCEVPETVRALQWIDARLTFQRACAALQNFLEGGNMAVAPPMAIPPRESSWCGFVPVLYMAVPASVRSVASAAPVLLGCKAGWTAFLFLVGDADSIFSVPLLMGGIVAAFIGYRGARRRHTFTEMLLFFSVLPVCALFVSLLSATGVINERVGFGSLAICVLDLLVLAPMVFARSFRRWMVAYPVGLGFRD